MHSAWCRADWSSNSLRSIRVSGDSNSICSPFPVETEFLYNNRNGRSPTRDRLAIFTHVPDDIRNELVVRDVLQLRDRYSFGFFE